METHPGMRKAPGRFPRYLSAWPAVLLALAWAAGPGPAFAADDPGDLRSAAFASLWNEDSDRAHALFTAYLDAPGARRDRETLLGLALACSWSGRQARAVDLYRELATSEPDDPAARIGLGRSLIWANRYREGWEALKDVESRFGPASAGGRDARRFRLKVLDEYTPLALIGWESSWDSDDLDIARFRIQGAVPAAGILLHTGPRVSRYRQPGRPDLTALRWEAGAGIPLRRNLALHAAGWLESFRSDEPLEGDAEKLDWNRPGGDFWFTWLPRDRVRLDAGAGYQAVETFLAFGRRLALRQTNLSADLRLTRRIGLTAVGRLGEFTDGNQRRQGRLAATWKHEGAVDLQLATAFTVLDHSRPYPGGYWAPDHVAHGGLEAAAVLWRSRFVLRAAGSLGREKETGADAITVGGGSVHLGLRLSGDWLVAVDAGHSRSAINTDSGYRRTSAGLSLRGIF